MPESNSKTIVVLGAYGEAGSAIAHGLAAEEQLNVVATGRDRGKLRRLRESCENLAIAPLDVHDGAALKNMLLEADLVVNCVGPYIGSGLEIARTAVQTGTAYFDLASEQEHYRRLRSLDAAGRQTGSLILAGVGAYPGLSGILLNALMNGFSNGFSGEMALISGRHAEPEGGAAQAVSGVIELAYALTDLENGQLRRVTPGGRKAFDFPEPFGSAEVMRWPQLEILALAATHRIRDFETFVMLGGEKPPPSLVLRALGYLSPTPGSWVLRQCKRVLNHRHVRSEPRTPDPMTNQGALIFVLRSAETTHTASVHVTDIPAATAWLPVYAAKQWAAGRLSARGLHIPMEVFDSDEVLAAIRSAGMGFRFQGF
ncbi:MAG: hypothetical protein GY946_19650 [bacterium]|nr:hypothetical protein [bacterium]